jgi:hypothetical protein
MNKLTLLLLSYSDLAHCECALTAGTAVQVIPPFLVCADYKDVGLLRVSSDEYGSYAGALAAIRDLPPSEQLEAAQVPLIHLSTAPVDHRAGGDCLAEHLPASGEPGAYDETAPVFSGSLSVHVRLLRLPWPISADSITFSSPMSISCNLSQALLHSCTYSTSTEHERSP